MVNVYFAVCFSAVLEFMCDLTYNITMSLIHTSVQGAVFQAVLKQEIAFFDRTPTGKPSKHWTNTKFIVIPQEIMNKCS